jgi:hypothetical protein
MKYLFCALVVLCGCSSIPNRRPSSASVANDIVRKLSTYQDGSYGPGPRAILSRPREFYRNGLPVFKLHIDHQSLMVTVEDPQAYFGFASMVFNCSEGAIIRDSDLEIFKYTQFDEDGVVCPVHGSASEASTIVIFEMSGFSIFNSQKKLLSLKKLKQP